ncbi:MAG: hypothetical protein COB37_10235 [Kordiimonadales bacterium]|nr:MAG: hypothetical protein COB37_10235 [Kordiimonadales bacterium]
MSSPSLIFLRILIFTCIFGVLQVAEGYALKTNAQSTDNLPGFLDFNGYPILTETKSDNYLTINAFQKISTRLSYFSLNNFGTRKGTNGNPDTNTFYTEQSLRWKITENSPFDLTVQLNFRSGDNNDRHRLGIRWRLNDTAALKGFFKSINLAYSVNLHALQLDHEDPYVWQLEHAFKMTFPYLTDRLYLAGFADQTFNQNLPDNFPSAPIVGEAQLGFRLFDNLYAIGEFRINEFRRSDVDNIGLGIQYKVSW